MHRSPVRRRPVVLSVLLAVLLLSAYVLPVVAMAAISISGTVRSELPDEPLEGAVVEVHAPVLDSDFVRVATATVAPDGTYSFTGLPEFADLPFPTDRYIVLFEDPSGEYGFEWWYDTQDPYEAENDYPIYESATGINGVLADGKPPVVTSDVSGEPYPESATIVMTATDGGSGVQSVRYQMDDGAPVTTAGDTASASTTDLGMHALQFSAVDRSGNRSTTSTVNFTVADITAPVVVDDIPTPPEYADEATVTLTATDSGSGVASITYQLDSETSRTVNAATAQVATRVWGGHSLTYYATDVEGNSSEPVDADFEVLDTIDPEVSDDARDIYLGTASITMTATDSGSGVATVSYRVDSEATVTVGGPTAIANVTAIGSHTLVYTATDNAGNTAPAASAAFTVRSPVPDRLAGADRYLTALDIAREGFPGWADVDDVIIASGEDRALADPLSAAGLVWVYDAPIILVQSKVVPSAVKTALNQIGAANEDVTMHVVGGPVAVSQSVVDQAAAALRQGGADTTVDRLNMVGTRFDTAATIAGRVRAKAGGTVPVALIANGADNTKFSDALALSPLAAKKGYPILLVGQNVTPNATLSALRSLGAQTIIVGGGTATISNDVYQQVGADERWWGNDRYLTAVDIADKATKRGWLAGSALGVAAKIPDALTGGAFIGTRDGVLLLTQTNQLPSAASAWIAANKQRFIQAYVFGGEAVISQKVVAQIAMALD